MKKQKAKAPVYTISADEYRLAAKYFTLANTAMLGRGDNLDFMYDQANTMMAFECGVYLTEELYSWIDTIASGDQYCAKQWSAVRTQYIKQS